MISFNLEVLILLINIILAIFFLIRRWLRNRKQNKSKTKASKFFGAEWVLLPPQISKQNKPLRGKKSKNKTKKIKKKIQKKKIEIKPSLGESPQHPEMDSGEDIWWRTDETIKMKITNKDHPVLIKFTNLGNQEVHKSAIANRRIKKVVKD